MRCRICLVAGGLPLVVLATILQTTRDPADAKPKPLGAVRSAECRWATGPLKLDGVLDEAAWKSAPVLSEFSPYWLGRPAKTATRARLLWDKDNLYFAAEMEDADLYADVK